MTMTRTVAFSSGCMTVTATRTISAFSAIMRASQWACFLRKEEYSDPYRDENLGESSDSLIGWDVEKDKKA